MGNYMKQIIEHEVKRKIKGVDTIEFIYTFWENGKEYRITKAEADAEVSADPENENVEIKPFDESIVGLAKSANAYKGPRSDDFLNEKSIGEQFGMLYDLLEPLYPTDPWIVWQKGVKDRWPKS